VVGVGLAHRAPQHEAPVRVAAEIADGFGFVVGVLADYGIRAERAWALPSELERRMGTLDPTLLARRLDDIIAACRSRPMLHRFPNRFATFVHHAATRVSRDYGGQARRLWSGTPTATALQIGFAQFDGIGQKKAAMAVDLVMRELGVSVAAPSGNDVAYDVHVRRVFLRTGLVPGDDPALVLDAARELSPDHPAALDYPSWHIGRSYCRPTSPACERCPLEFACHYAEEQRAVLARQLVLFRT